MQGALGNAAQGLDLSQAAAASAGLVHRDLRAVAADVGVAAAARHERLRDKAGNDAGAVDFPIVVSAGWSCDLLEYAFQALWDARDRRSFIRPLRLSSASVCMDGCVLNRLPHRYHHFWRRRFKRTWTGLCVAPGSASPQLSGLRRCAPRTESTRAIEYVSLPPCVLLPETDVSSCADPHCEVGRRRRA